MNFATWPFVSASNRLPAEETRWWEECYLPSPVQTFAEGYSQGCVILGGYQSGRSTALAALKRLAQTDFLIVEDEFLAQPGQDASLGNALYRLLSQAIWLIHERLRDQPELFAQIRSRMVLGFICSEKHIPYRWRGSRLPISSAPRLSLSSLTIGGRRL